MTIASAVIKIAIVIVFLIEQVSGEPVGSIAVNQRFRAVIETPALHVVRAAFANDFQRCIEQPLSKFKRSQVRLFAFCCIVLANEENFQRGNDQNFEQWTDNLSIFFAQLAVFFPSFFEFVFEKAAFFLGKIRIIDLP